MTKETVLTHHVLFAFGQNEREDVRLALVNGGEEKVSDLKQLTFEYYSQLEYTQNATTTIPAVITHLNKLQWKRLLLILLWFCKQNNYELAIWFQFQLTPELFDNWRAQIVMGIKWRYCALCWFWLYYDQREDDDDEDGVGKKSESIVIGNSLE